MKMNMIISPEDYRIFSEVAKHRNLSKAAAALFISQSALSRRILQLEKELGLVLFDRTPQGVELTPGGKLILDQYNLIDESFRTLLKNARLYNNGQMGLITIGVQDGHLIDDHTLSFIRLFTTRYPGIKLDIQCLSHANLLERIKTGHLDVGFMNNFDLVDLENVCHCVTCRAQGHIVLSADHVLAIDEGLYDFSQLNKETLLVTDPSVAKAGVTFVQNICRTCGFFPREIRLAPSHSTMMLWVIIGIGFAISCKNAWYGHPRIKFIPLPEHAFCDQVAVWNRENHNPTSKLFIADLEDYQLISHRTCENPLISDIR